MSGKRSLYEELGATSSLSAPSFGSRDSLEASPDPIVRTQIHLTLSQLQPYDRNPRQGPNPAYSELKESIRARGLEHPPAVTRRPGSEFYIINSGGNTRLQILSELFEETKDRRFYEIACDFVPWESESKILSGHLIENDVRGNITFIDRARALRELLETIAQEDQKDAKDIGIRDFSRRLAAMGYSISPSTLSRLFQALDLLYPYIPDALHSGIGKPQIEKILGLRAALGEVWQSRGHDESKFVPAFAHALALTDSDTWSAENAQELVLRDMCKQIDVSYSELLLEVEARISGKKLPSKTTLVVTPAIVGGGSETPQSNNATTDTNPFVEPTFAGASAVSNLDGAPSVNLASSIEQEASSVEPIDSSADFEDAMAIDLAALAALEALEQYCARISSDVDVLRELLASKAQSFASMISNSQTWVVSTPGIGIGYSVLSPSEGFFCDAIKARSEVYWFLFSLTADAHGHGGGQSPYTTDCIYAALPLVSETNIFTTAEWDSNTTASALAMTAIARRIRHLLAWK